MTKEKFVLEREKTLFKILKSMRSVLVAFSGGVDSAYLAYAAHKTLKDKALAVTAESPALPSREKNLIPKIIKKIGVRYETISTDELSDENYKNNSLDRCFFCKSELYEKLLPLAKKRGYAWVANGANTDDLGDVRPGMDAARKFGVRSPFIEAKLTKEDIRLLSRRAGLPTWDMPASACLASRVPFGEKISAEKLFQIDRAECALHKMGFRHVRVRHHGALARVEFGGEDFKKALDPKILSKISRALRKAGFSFITMDLDGYREAGKRQTKNGK